jgi:hypothetical protein
MFLCSAQFIAPTHRYSITFYSVPTKARTFENLFFWVSFTVLYEVYEVFFMCHNLSNKLTSISYLLL